MGGREEGIGQVVHRKVGCFAMGLQKVQKVAVQSARGDSNSAVTASMEQID